MLMQDCKFPTLVYFFTFTYITFGQSGSLLHRTEFKTTIPIEIKIFD